MSAKKTHRNDEDQAEDASSEGAAPHNGIVTDLLKNVDVGPWLDRASAMLQARPAVTIGAAMGAGFILGLTLFSKLGRVALIGAIGLGTELALHKLRRVETPA